jgi:hypothetical protein
MTIFVSIAVSLVVGFGLGVWYCKPVRDELKALRAQAFAKVTAIKERL